MQTTALVVEILVIGIITLLSLLLISFSLIDCDPKFVIETAKNFKDYSAIILVAMLAISYQLGWLINLVAYIASEEIYMKSMRRSVLKEKTPQYENMRNTVLIKAGENAVAKLKERMSGVRITRTGSINLFLISIGCLLIKYFVLAIILFILSILIGLASRYVYRDYFNRVISMYEIINN